MLQALWSASAGMLAQQTSMDTVANNISNINTPGYKKNRVEFQDLLYNNIRGPGLQTRNGQVVENGIQVGTGTRPAATQLLLEQGGLQLTGNPTDFAITGNAFFEVLLPDGSKAYTRDGSFKIDADGNLVTGSGYLVNIKGTEPGLVTFPEGASKLNVDDSGIFYRDKELLKLEAYTFTSAKDLKTTENGVFIPTEVSGEPVLLADALAAQEEADAELEVPTDEEGNPLPVDKVERPKPQVYYQVTLPEGDTGYVTDSSFKIDETGRLVTIDKGYPLEPGVLVDTAAFPLKTGDTVTANSDGVINISTEEGRLSIVQFANPAGLEKIGSNLYIQTANSGNAQTAEEFSVVPGNLEMSNVQVAEEMVNMMIAQRAYELCSRSIKTSDDMLGQANALLRR